MSKERNEVCRWLPEGLHRWHQAGAQVCFLNGRQKEREVEVPRILAPAWTDERNLFSPQERRTIIFLAGFHLEETSGCRFLLDPSYFNFLRLWGYNCLIYPVINQYGLQFPRQAEERLLRFDPEGINYNDGWGGGGLKKRRTLEGWLVERDILRGRRRGLNYVLGVTAEEDSECPPFGYSWVNGLDQPEIRAVKQRVENSWAGQFLPRSHPYRDGPASRVMGGLIDDWLVVDAQDGGSVQNWLCDHLGVPVVTIEAPFAAKLETRVLFQNKVTEALIMSQAYG